MFLGKATAERGLSIFPSLVYHFPMKLLPLSSLLPVLALLIMLLDAFWFHPRAVRAQGTLKVYVQQVKQKQWTDIQGKEIVGFACGVAGMPISGTTSECFVASR